MTTIQRTLSILAMAVFVGLSCNTTDAMARGNHHDHNNKRVVHVERKVVKQAVRHRGPRHVVHHRAPRHIVHHRAPRHVVPHYAPRRVVRHYAPRPFGLSFSNGYVSVSLPGIHFR